MRRVLTVYFCVCGTFEPKTQENGLNLDKFIIKSHQIRRGEMANATARNCQRPIGD